MTNIPDKAAEASTEAILDDLLTLPVEHRGLVVRMLVRYAETAQPFIAAQVLNRMADKFDQYGSAAAEGGKVAEARTYRVAAALTREQAEWGIPQNCNQEDQA